MKRIKSTLVAVFAVVLATVPVVPAGLVPSVFAAQSTGSASLGIEPKKNYVIEPGKSVHDKLVLHNLDQRNPLQMSLRVIDFSYTGDTGSPKLFLAQDAPQTTWSLKPYMSVPQSVTVPAGGSKSLPISVAMPRGIGAGSYYSAIIYSTGAPNGLQVGLAASGVTLVFTTVPGKVNENMVLQKFGAYHVATSTRQAGYDFITNQMPMNIGYTLKNNGNVAESPVGSITLKPLFGKPTVINDINPAGSLALIGQGRTFTACIKSKVQDDSQHSSSNETGVCVPSGLWPGMYTATLDVYYGQNGNITQEITGTSTFWYLPTWFMIILLVIIAIVAFYGYRLYRKINYALNGGRPKRSRHR